METIKEKEKDLKDKVFDLKEVDGGRQLIAAVKELDKKRHLVISVGNGPKIDFVSGKPIDEEIASIPKLRFFDFTFKSGSEYDVYEYIDPDDIAKIETMFLKEGVDLTKLLDK